MSNVVGIGKATRDDVDRVLEQVSAAEPDEVLVVYLKAGDVHTLSTGTFSKMRTLGALEIVKHDLLH